MDDEEKDLASLGVTLITPILGEPLAILKETKTSLQDNRTNRGRPETPPRTPEEVTASPGKSQTSLGKVRIMPLEVHRDVDEVVNLLKERPNQYSRATVVLYGSGDYLSKAVKQAVGADVVTPGQVWVLVSEGSLHHYSRFLVTHTLTSQFNLLLVTQVTKTHQDRSPAITPVTALRSSPTLRVVESAGDGGPHLVGFLAEVMAFLQQSLHFRYNVSQVRGYGTRLINGSWIGLVGAVAEKVEVGLSSLSITYERRQVVSFTSHLLESSVYLMFPAKHILKPIFVVFLIFTPLRSTITLNTNTSTSPSSPSSGNLTAFLSIPRLQQYPSTPEEMLQQGYAPLLTKGFSHYDNFKYSRLDTFQKLFRVAQERGSIYPFGRVDHNTVMDRFSESPVASIISALGVVYRQNSGAGPNQPCAFYVEPEPLSSQFSYIILQNNSFFRQLFNRRLIWLRDMGVLKRASQKHNAIHCLGGGGMGDGVDGGGSVSGGSLPLSLTDLQGAFLLWVAGTVLSLLFLLVEVVVVRCVGGDRSGVSC
ncbi:uncharacterized protein LOC121854972 [Homarus americanus]|uniref:uncharacterized protein LOC121854972 n=1 Tax=Homarus americanus TaxID=6706 RepID=UPI001C44B5E8|nr:uncharacterized protein LOC121854972 [Homarus americanus]